MENKGKKQVTLKRLFNAPRELVFNAWTDAGQLQQWWGPKMFTNPVCEADARPGGKIHIHMQAPDGTVYPMTGEYKEVTRPSRLVFITQALDSENKFLFEVYNEVTFADVGEQTEVTVFASAAEVTPETKPYLDGMDAGWSQSLDKLNNFAAAPFTIERTYNSPADKVWAAISDRDQMKQWYFDLAEFKAVVGFEFQFNGGTEENTYVHLCKVTEVIPGRKLTYSWRYKGYEGNSFVSFELFPQGHQTRLVLTHVGLATFPASNKDLAKSNFEMGWNAIIGESLKKYLEGA